MGCLHQYAREIRTSPLKKLSQKSGIGLEPDKIGQIHFTDNIRCTLPFYKGTQFIIIYLLIWRIFGFWSQWTNPVNYSVLYDSYYIILFWHPHKPVNKHGNCSVDTCVASENTPIPPSLWVVSIQGSQENICVVHLTKCTILGGSVGKISTSDRHVRSHELSTS